MSKTWDIWAEGYAATGESGGATCLASNVTADSFSDACDKALGNSNFFNRDDLTYWGCRLYDNHRDAQESYG